MIRRGTKWPSVKPDGSTIIRISESVRNIDSNPVNAVSTTLGSVARLTFALRVSSCSWNASEQARSSDHPFVCEGRIIPCSCPSSATSTPDALLCKEWAERLVGLSFELADAFSRQTINLTNLVQRLRFAADQSGA